MRVSCAICLAALVCSGTTRLLLDDLVKEWKDPEFSVSGVVQPMHRLLLRLLWSRRGLYVLCFCCYPLLLFSYA